MSYRDSSTDPARSDSLHDEIIQDLTETLTRIGSTIASCSTTQNSQKAALQEELSKTRAELRASEEKQAVTRDDALHNSRVEILSARELLAQLWTLLQAKEVEVPVSIRVEYRLFMKGDPWETKPAFGATASSHGESGAPQNIRVPMREYQPRAKLPRPLLRWSPVHPTIHNSMPLSTLNPPLARINGEFADTRRSQATTVESSAATDSLVSKEEAAGTKRGAWDRDLTSAKRLRVERDSDDLDTHTPDHPVPDVDFKTEGESEKEHVRVKTEE